MDAAQQAGTFGDRGTAHRMAVLMAAVAGGNSNASGTAHTRDAYPQPADAVAAVAWLQVAMAAQQDGYPDVAADTAKPQQS
jgi:hypothetical protein